MNNQFSPMSEDKTPVPHQRFFGPQTESMPPEGPAPSIDDFAVNPLPEETPAPEAGPETPAPETEAPTTEATPVETSAPKERDAYYNETKDHLMHVRKQRNAIILQMDKLEDERIEKGSEDFDDASRELSKLQNDLWRKNNLIEALVKVLVSLG
jgi:hypothetical protein